MPQHILSDAVIPECGAFPLRHPYAHNCLYSLYNFKFFKTRIPHDIAQGRVKCCLEDGVCLMCKGWADRGVWQRGMGEG